MKHPAASLVQGQLESTWALRVSPLGTLTFQAKKNLQKEWKVGYLRAGFSVRQSIHAPLLNAKLSEDPEFESIESMESLETT